jgi:hypothetical protein
MKTTATLMLLVALAAPAAAHHGRGATFDMKRR